jgi:hypothetical protein
MTSALVIAAFIIASLLPPRARGWHNQRAFIYSSDYNCSLVHQGLHVKTLKPMIAARTVLAVLLALIVLAGVAPFDALSAAGLCSLPCCAGLPPHAADSCPACHAHVTRKRGGKPELLCGAHNLLARRHKSAPARFNLQADSPANTTKQTAHLGALVLTQPCAPDCGAGLCGFASLRRERDPSVLAHDTRPRPPTLIQRAPNPQLVSFALQAGQRQTPPRAPPPTFV